MRLTRRMGPDYRACARGRLLRLFVWSSCLAAVLTLRPFAAAQDARPGFAEDDPRIKTSAPIFFDRVDTVRVTPFGSVSDPGVRTASAGLCEQQSTYTDADFDGPGDYSIVFGLAETEIMAASYTIAPEFFPIEIQSVEMVFAQIGNQDMVTELELLILKGTPNQGQVVATIPHTLNFPACDDGIFCNGTETCSDGSCVSGLAPCFGQICNENIAACVECLSAASCDDGDSCTLDTCNAVGQCEFTIDVFASCDDGEVCTVDDTCNAVGQCGGVPDVGASCNDGDVCTANDTCDAVGQCGGQPDVGAPCDDGDGCTGTDVCDAGGQCVGEPCDDGLFCNGLERCVGDVCVTATPPCVPQSCDEEADVCECVADNDCDDGNPCTDDVCVGSECQFPNNSLGCTDLDPCTVGDACAGGSCTGTPKDCDDGDACTQDTCNPGDGQCFHDTVQCPADQQCQPGTGNCVECLENTDCDDGLFCNGTATCNNASCVASSALPCPGQLCDEDSDPHCFDSDQGCDAINILIDLSANPVLVENNGNDTFSVGFRIVTHNNQTENPCTVNPPANSNAFPTVDVSGVQNEVENWVLMVNCGPLGCPAGWNRFEDLAFCEPDGDWVLRATWTSAGCDLERACCFEDGTCELHFETACADLGGTFQPDETTCDPNPCPPPIEACCFTDTEGCIDLDPAFCTNVGGGPAGSDTSCASFTCFPTGACCKPNGFCVDDVSMGECADTHFGTFQGNDTTCNSTTCPDPEGACCFSTEFCIVLPETQCEQGGATWHGPLTDCNDGDGDELPDECQNAPIGACCLPDFTCADDQTSEACAAAGGAFQGTGSECVDIGDECVAPTGACCLPAGQCLPDENVTDCEAVGGVYQGNDSDCTSCQTQACCFEGAGCLDFPFTTCAAAGGSAQGAGTTCATTQCPLAEGACCFETGLCLGLTLGECNQGGGSWLGGDSVCEPNPCAGVAIGACCLAGDQCIDDSTPAECLAQAGEFQGDTSICATVQCDVAQEIEACCASTGACIDLTPDDCIGGIGGTPQGPGSTCANTECAEPVGACCAGDGSCSELTEADCGAGSYLGDGSDCAAGECCQSDPDCDDADVCNGAETCLANVCQEGAPLDCDDTDVCTGEETCDPSLGCQPGEPLDCDDSDDCTEDTCDSVIGCEHTPIVPCCGNGILEPPGEECDPPDGITCDETCHLFPTGACCFITGNCQVISENACIAASGTYQADDTACTPDLCPGCTPTKGAAENDCCADADPIFTGLTNFDTTNSNTDGPIHLGACEFDGQTYHDIWYEYTADCTADTIVTTCEDFGAGADYDTDLVVYDGCDCDNLFLLACSDDDDSCGGDPITFQSTVTISMVAGNCYLVRIGGWFDEDFGTGTLLIDPQCGACCQGDTCLENLGSGECADAGGDYQGEDTVCADIDCTVTGACCSVAGECADTTLQACVAQNGDYQGDGTDCKANPCSTCPQDLDGNGEVEAFDLALVLGFWGACEEPCEPGPPATTCLTDLSGDCTTGAFDLALILGFWGPCP